MTRRVNSFGSYVLAGAIAMALAGCGGGASQTAATPDTPVTNPPVVNPPTQPTTSNITGVAAVGAPLSGTVTVKDALGATKTVTIGSNGAYTVDVTGMTAPFVFRAEGNANGQQYTVHSAAAAADVNGIINITQLTELMIANIAGQIASNYFDSGDFASLSKTALDAEAAALKEKLQPILTALGVEGSVDLLRTQFTPLSSSLDAALDVIRVSVDTQTNVATITNIVTQQKLTDDLAVKAAGESSPAQLTDTTGVKDAASDIALVKAAITNFAAKFATGLPSQATLLAALSPTYLADDEDAATFAANMSSNPELVGVKFTDVDVLSVDYDNPNGATAYVNLTMANKDGVEMARVKTFGVRRGGDGVWRIQGNSRMLSVEGHVHTYRGNKGGVCTLTGLEFLIEDLDDTNNNNIDVDHIMVYGPGLPNKAIRYNPPANGGYWTVQGGTSAYFVMGSSCQTQRPVTDADIAAIPDNADYYFVAYSSTDNSVKVAFPTGALSAPGKVVDGGYKITIEKRPLTLAEAVASTQFPKITAPTGSDIFQATYTSGALTITASNMNPLFFADVALQQNTQSGNYRDAEAWAPPSAAGTFSTSLSLTAAAQNDPITFRALNVATQDIYRRTFMTGF